MAVHAHSKTMTNKWPTVWIEISDRIAAYIRKFGVNFIAAGFNMSLTEVPGQLRSRGILCDCVAYYPWKHIDPPVDEELRTTAALGLESCGIFYIGGTAQVTPLWGLKHVDMLSSVSAFENSPMTAVADARLHEYVGHNTPGKHWTCYRSGATGQVRERNLQSRLRDLLAPTWTQEALNEIPRRERVPTQGETEAVFGGFCPYLRVHRKKCMLRGGSSTE